MCVGIKALVLLLVLSFGAFLNASAQTIEDCNQPEIICRAAYNQGNSLYKRDHCRYEQRLRMERYKYDRKKTTVGEVLATRLTTVVVQPDSKPDETGGILVLTTVVADTNDKGEPKDKVDPNARTGLASGRLLDEVFFPLLPEKVRFLEFEEVKTDAAGERWFQFKPRVGAGAPSDMVLASGMVQLDSATGQVLTMRIDGFSNLAGADKHFKDIENFKAKVDYSQFGGVYRLPTAANGEGISNIRQFQGFFKFVFEEGKYVAVSTGE